MTIISLIPIIISSIVIGAGIGFAIGKNHRVFPVNETYAQQLIEEYRARYAPDEIDIFIGDYASLERIRFTIEHELKKDDKQVKSLTYTFWDWDSFAKHLEYHGKTEKWTVGTEPSTNGYLEEYVTESIEEHITESIEEEDK